MKTKRRKWTGTMYALRWLDSDGEINPHPASKHGAWMLCSDRVMAQFKRVSKKQVITRVKVTIE
jgi:hypothetical protein